MKRVRTFSAKLNYLNEPINLKMKLEGVGGITCKNYICPFQESIFRLLVHLPFTNVASVISNNPNNSHNAVCFYNFRIWQTQAKILTDAINEIGELRSKKLFSITKLFNITKLLLSIFSNKLPLKTNAFFSRF